MYKLYFDGASRENPGKSASSYVIYDTNDKRIQYGYYIFPRDATNNEAEYMGLSAGLRASISLDIKSLHIFGDSKLVLECVFGSWKVHKDTLKPYCYYAKNLIKEHFNEIEWDWIEREKNIFADALCNKALDNNISKNDNYFKIPESIEEVEIKEDKMSTKNMLKEVLKQLVIINERLDKLEQVKPKNVDKLDQIKNELLPNKEQQSNCGKRWTQEQEEYMLNEIEKNIPINNIADSMKRTHGGIRSRLLMIARKMIHEENKSYEEASKVTSLSVDYIKTGKLNF
jgi:ribonuclease HI